MTCVSVCQKVNVCVHNYVYNAGPHLGGGGGGGGSGEGHSPPPLEIYYHL